MFHRRSVALSLPVAWVATSLAYWNTNVMLSAHNGALTVAGLAAIAVGILAIVRNPKKQRSGWQFAILAIPLYIFAWSTLLFGNVIPYADWRSWILASGMLIQALLYIVSSS